VDTVISGAVFALTRMLLVAHIFSLDNWGALARDANDPNKSADVFVTRGISRRNVARRSLGLLAASLTLFALLRRQTRLLRGHCRARRALPAPVGQCQGDSAGSTRSPQ